MREPTVLKERVPNLGSDLERAPVVSEIADQYREAGASGVSTSAEHLWDFRGDE